MSTVGGFRNGFGNDVNSRLYVCGSQTEDEGYEASRGGNGGNGHVLNGYGSTVPQLTTAKAKYGSTSWFFDDTTSYLSVGTAGTSSDWSFGLGDFTIDFWVFAMDGGGTATTSNLSNVIFGVYQDTNNYQLGQLTRDGFDTQFTYNVVENGSEIVSLSTDWSSNFDKWIHGSIVRHGSLFALFAGGKILDYTIRADVELASISQPFFVGNATSSGYYSMYYDEFRVSKGIARWNNEFTVPNRSYGPRLYLAP